ncbi:NAD(P)-dependent glycerol-3-phosphate dehydrogenase [Glutamicibacter sp. JL.03c]|uniref:NAD(P)H-dependent glycerol-3-phosphate dehydrogenase n=1 Tax=Glutamicibacter sp. JL.03c TaxID=2984842 RepID=UPI0021F712F6|nr:NAD(P)H-dependent glycerol-3-phosphate dehydrogenase [Glutamicibacter sp. JL.03c]UYQ78844.1 NAD(P)-dependent glycerol-3-phosphate dehydrogenase [Glutamicibacter sp. JL.03c]
MTMPLPRKIAVMGAGSWGTTFAKVLADSVAAQGIPVQIWARRDDAANEINERHTNSRYLRETKLPANISASSNQREVLEGADLVVLAIPSQSLRRELAVFKKYFEPEAVLLSLMKGLERGTDLRMSEVIAEITQFPEDRIAVLSGPNLAMEIAREQPTASVVACADSEIAQWIAELCSASYFRPYTNDDVLGVELGGIVKNIIALAVGMCDGMGMGDNTKSTVITRGLAETTRLVLSLGGRLDTLAGLSGLGDLVATCSSSLSRNNTAGRLLGQGLFLDEVNDRMSQTAEGIKSARAVFDLARAHEVEMPITEAVVMVLEGSLSVENMAARLLARELKSEGEQN